jgi:Sec-independent protein translocase protein TatA
VGFGTELVFLVMLGLVVLGPKRLHSMLGYLGRAKAEFDKASREIKSQLSAELQRAPQKGKSSPAEVVLTQLRDNARQYWPF